MEFTISNEDLEQAVGSCKIQFPKYTTQIINLANQNAQGTRPEVVGQMTALIREFPGRTLDEWVSWYGQRHPDELCNATIRILTMLSNLKQAIEKIDRSLVDQWVRDLVFAKTFKGLRIQELILKRIAEDRGESYRISTPDEESRGIDGFVGKMAFSVKPESYKAKRALRETLQGTVVYYKETRTGLRVHFEGL